MRSMLLASVFAAVMGMSLCAWAERPGLEKHFALVGVIDQRFGDVIKIDVGTADHHDYKQVPINENWTVILLAGGKRGAAADLKPGMKVGVNPASGPAHLICVLDAPAPADSK